MPSSIPDEQLQEGVSYWARRWAEKSTGWELKEVNCHLLAQVNALTGAPGSKSKKILVPLCGQTVDLMYLLSLGHEVFGIEAVSECIDGLTERDGFQFNFNEAEFIYSTDDGKLKIFVGDIFKFEIEKYGPFDCIWDRGSLVALEYVQHKKYVELMKRGVKSQPGKANDFRYLLEAFQYDKAAGYNGPPRSVNDEDVTDFFSSWAEVQVISKVPLKETPVSFLLPEELGAYQIVYMLSPK